MKRVYRFDWAGASAFVLALSLGIGFGGTLILIAGPWDPDPLSDTGATLLSTVGGVLAGAVAAYLGAQVERSRRTEASEAPVAPEGLPSWEASDQLMSPDTLERAKAAGEAAEAERQRKLERRGE